MLRSLALLWLILGVLVSPWVVPVWAGSKPLEKAFLPLATASALFLALAGLGWFYHRKAFIRRLTLLAALGLLFAPLAAEAALRLSFRIPSSPSRVPLRFGHNLIHDDYWILAGRWKTYGDQIVAERVHRDLGWSQTYPTKENPLGIGQLALERLVKDGRPKVLFYGDSYVAGHSSPENHLPNFLHDRLPGTDVVHLGVGGYGTGQALRLYEETSASVERPFVIMSAMVYDLDRSGLTVRSYQKPRLRVDEGGALEVTNTPIDPDPDHFYASADLSFRSYALRALENWCLPLKDPGFQDKLRLNRAILQAVKARAEAEGSLLLYVLFHPIQEVKTEDYRSIWFHETLAELEIDVFDTRDVLLAYIEQPGTKLGDLYVTGHHNDLGNEVIGAALLKELRQRGLR